MQFTLRTLLLITLVLALAMGTTKWLGIEKALHMFAVFGAAAGVFGFVVGIAIRRAKAKRIK